MQWKLKTSTLEIGPRRLVMGIVNVTPDSFSDGGAFIDADTAIDHGVALFEAGADILDIGGESTRPGAAPVSVDEEMRRVLPVIEGLAARTEAVLSIDTSKATVAREAVARGAEIINDVTAGQGDPAMFTVAAETRAGLILMHMQGTPRTMQDNPQYVDVVGEVGEFLQARAEAAKSAGVDPAAIAIDPGIGFGKTMAHNIALHRRLGELCQLGYPVLVGNSRKAFIGALLGGLPPAQRVEGTAAAVTVAILNGAAIVRVHDVLQIARAVRVAEAIAEWSL